MEQHCWRCKETKPLSEFYKNRARPNGFADTCKKCTLEIQHLKHPGKRSGVIKEVIKEPKRRPVCAALKVHAKKFGGDPEHLTTEFIQKIVGRKC